jgi:hypothetical protein
MFRCSAIGPARPITVYLVAELVKLMPYCYEIYVVRLAFTPVGAFCLVPRG